MHLHMKAFVIDTTKVDQTSKDLFTRGFVVREDLTEPDDFKPFSLEKEKL